MTGQSKSRKLRAKPSIKKTKRIVKLRVSKARRTVSVTEVHAYAHVLRELTTKKGWNKDQIYTQNECQNNPFIKNQLGEKTPENIVEIFHNQFYVIEAKSKRDMLDQALDEARDYYAKKMNESVHIKTPFITGIAGNEKEGYIAKSQFLRDGVWQTITENGAEVTGLLSKAEIEQILKSNDPNLKDIEISEVEFLRAAEEINGILHENAIHKDARAKLISAILLALSRKTDINLNLDPVELANSINTRVDLELKRHGKADFSRFIHIDLPSSEDNHVKLKTAIVKSIEILLGLNIHSAMRSGKDVLGKFYEVFLKYGNGAKEIGIVLTPRHITRFAAEVIDIQTNDLVLDPTCGTGGFLVAAFDDVKKKTATDKDFEKFKKWGLYGIEEQDPIVALALVNMIFRGDGKNNIIEGNCFAKWLNLTTRDGEAAAEFLTAENKEKLEQEGKYVAPITKILMNPPFPKKKADKKEFLFIEQALKQMQDEGLLFTVLPYSCMIRAGAYQNWRNRLLKENTLLCVITFPAELFSPIGVRTIGLFLKKGVPHLDKKVLWIRALHDGFKLKKGKRLPSSAESNDLETVKPLLKTFLKVPESTSVENISRFQKLAPIDFKDPQFELVPEAYLDEKPPTPEEIETGMEELVRETVAFVIRSRNENNVASE